MNSYVVSLNRHLEALCPGISESLGTVAELEPEVGKKVLGQILCYACGATHESAIQAGQKAFAALPQAWLDEHLDAAIPVEVNLEDYWDYRLLLGTLEEGLPASASEVSAPWTGFREP